MTALALNGADLKWVLIPVLKINKAIQHKWVKGVSHYDLQAHRYQDRYPWPRYSYQRS